MKKTKFIISVIIVALISAMAGSAITIGMLKKDLAGTGSSGGSGTDKVVYTNGETKNQNVYQAVAKSASPSVVGIVSEVTAADNIFDTPETKVDSGTGFIVDKKGYILTNSHVISDGKAKNVRVILSDSTTTPGKVVWYDRNLDLAIVKVDKKGLTPIELGDSDKVTVGDIAIAIGNPLGTDLMTTVTQGIISGLNRDVSTENNNMSGLLQTDASINPGNSGGPLLNQEGQVIGINTVKAKADNLGFAIPINIAKTIVQRVIEDGNYEKPVLGITGMDVQTFETLTGHELPVDNGVIVRTVVRDSIASKIGLKPADIIVKMGDNQVKNMGDISKNLYSYKKGEKSTITVNRDDKEIKLNVKY